MIKRLAAMITAAVRVHNGAISQRHEAEHGGKDSYRLVEAVVLQPYVGQAKSNVADALGIGHWGDGAGLRRGAGSRRLKGHAEDSVISSRCNECKHADAYKHGAQGI